tara:strand:- start:32 stop:352 length:321 start_codon:yes stop_codon:yes gene_type:complete
MSKNSKGHGNRKHLQVLVAPNRADLFIKYSENTLKKKPSAVLREILYDYLIKVIPEKEYTEAKTLDDKEWNKSIQNRLEGRAIAKIVNNIRKANISETFEDDETLS